jgi:hypothetical protein
MVVVEFLLGFMTQYFGQFWLGGGRMSPPLLRLCYPTQPRREVPHATASECTAWFTPHQETATKVSGPSVGTSADAPRPCWRDITDNCAYCLSAEQTPSVDKTPNSEATRMAVSLEQLARVVSEQHLRPLRYVSTDGYDSTQQFLGGVRALGLEHIGQLRLDATLRSLHQGPKRPGPGRPHTYDGKGHWDNLSRVEKGATEDDDLRLSQQVLNHLQCQCNLRVVLVVDPKHNRQAVLFRTDLPWDALTISRYYKARVQSALLFRDAKQFAGLPACQARAQAKRNVHFHASLSAVTLAKLAARQQTGEAASGFAMASLKRRAFNQHLIERISQHLAQGHSLEKSSPAYEELCNYGTITGLAA